MFRFMIFVVLLKFCLGAELTGCSEDSHCPTDFYCETNAFFCRECLRCEDFKRAPPLTSLACVKSVVECGPCIDMQRFHQGATELVVECDDYNKNNNVLEKGPKDIRLPVYAWVLIAIIVVTIAMVGFLLKTPLKNRITYSVLCRTDNQISRSLTTRNELQASAPDAPPAYNALYSNLEAASLMDTPKVDEESGLYIKPIMTRTAQEESREIADRQAAVAYNNPVYVRGASLPASNSATTNGAVAAVPVSFDSSQTSVSSVDGVMPGSVADNGNANITHTEANAAGLTMELCPNDSEDNQTDVNQTANSSASDSALEHNAPVIVVNNVINLQTVTLSESISSN